MDGMMVHVAVCMGSSEEKGVENGGQGYTPSSRPALWPFGGFIETERVY
jgi:hypothetical protein